MDREILHIDLNNFFASVECLYRPELWKVPMAVAGSKAQRHGIILAKNQLAKEKGVQTAEPIWQAERKCPGLVLVPPNGERYHRYATLAMEIYAQYTDQMESFGQDECWLDVTGSRRLFGTGLQIAEEIRARTKKELGLSVSIGLSFNKMFAKLGSDYKKPDAITQITRDNFRHILWPLPAADLLFVGPSTQKALEKYGITTIGAIARTDRALLERLFGKSGGSMWDTANGLDESPVTTQNNQREIKTVGNSTTTPTDLQTDQEVKKVLYQLAEQVAHRLRRHGLWAGGIQLTVRRQDLESYQRSCTLETPVADSQSLFDAAFALYKKAKEKSPVRSLGIRAERLSENGDNQCCLFATDKQVKRRTALERVADDVRDKYGNESLVRGLLYQKEEDQ